MVLATASNLLWTDLSGKNLAGYYLKLQNYRNTPSHYKQVEWTYEISGRIKSIGLFGLLNLFT